MLTIFYTICHLAYNIIELIFNTTVIDLPVQYPPDLCTAATATLPWGKLI